MEISPRPIGTNETGRSCVDLQASRRDADSSGNKPGDESPDYSQASLQDLNLPPTADVDVVKRLQEIAKAAVTRKPTDRPTMARSGGGED